MDRLLARFTDQHGANCVHRLAADGTDGHPSRHAHRTDSRRHNADSNRRCAHRGDPHCHYPADARFHDAQPGSDYLNDSGVADIPVGTVDPVACRHSENIWHGTLSAGVAGHHRHRCGHGLVGASGRVPGNPYPGNCAGDSMVRVEQNTRRRPLSGRSNASIPRGRGFRRQAA